MTAPAARPLRYGELDEGVVVRGLLSLARRVGVDRVTMRGLADELGSSAPAVYYHVRDKQAALDLLADAVLAGIALPAAGPWQERLTALYTDARRALLEVDGIAGLLQRRPTPPAGRRLDATARAILRDAGLGRREADAAHGVLYTYLLGAVGLEHTRELPRPDARADARFTHGLRVVLTGIAREAGLP